MFTMINVFIIFFCISAVILIFVAFLKKYLLYVFVFCFLTYESRTNQLIINRQAIMQLLEQLALIVNQMKFVQL